jgi:O-antigen/teichoic acid export membrane protein
LAIRRGVSEFLWVAGPKVLTGGLQFGANLVLLRYFGPEQFGILSVCLVAILLSDSIIGGATDSAVLRLAPLYNEKLPEKSLQYQQTGLNLKLLVAGVLAIPVLLLTKPLSELLFQNSSGGRFLALSVVALFGMLALRSAQMHFQVNRRFTPYGIADLLNSALKFGGLGVLLVVAQPTIFGVLGLYALAPALVTIGILTVSARPMLRAPFSIGVLAELAGTVKWYLATAMTGTIIARMDLFLVSMIAGVREAGIFSAAQAIALVPQLVGTYVAVVFSPRIMPMWEAGTLKSLYWRFQAAITALAIGAFVIAWFSMHGFAQWIFPASFARSGEAILVLLPAGLAALVNFPLTILLLLFLRPKLLFVLDCILLPALVGAYVWVIPHYGAIGAAAVTSAVALLKTAIMQGLAWKLLRDRTSGVISSEKPETLAVPEEMLNAQ